MYAVWLQKEMNLKVEDSTAVYDGQKHSVKVTIDVTEGTTILYSLDGSNFSETAPDIKDVTVTEGTTVYVKATNPDFADTEVKSAKVIITPRPVTITTGGGEKAYDGTALTNSVANISNLVSGETVTLKATGSQTLVGESDNTYSIRNPWKT